MVEINLSLRWIDAEETAHAFLLRDLLLKYQDENHCSPTKTVNVGIYNDLDDSATFWEHVSFRVMSFESWSGFSRWCKPKGIHVSAKKKVIDGLKIWWPSLIEIDAAEDNELLVMSKLRHL